VIVLVHHAHPQGQGVGRTADHRRPVVDTDGAFIRVVGAEQDVHQGRLAGAVLTQQPDDLSGGQGQVDAVVGRDGAEALGDAAHFQQRRLIVHNTGLLH
jgi:hypothetical protein